MVRVSGGDFATVFQRMSRPDQDNLVHALQVLCGIQNLGFGSACELVEKLGRYLAQGGRQICRQTRVSLRTAMRQPTSNKDRFNNRITNRVKGE